MKNIDSSLILKILSLLLLLRLNQQQQHGIYKTSIRMSKRALSRRKKKRIPWEYVDSMLNARQFRRMFRMTRECFHLLCEKMKITVGESEFKSEAYINAFLNKKGSIYNANCETTGGFISGEVKMGITIRLLAGGDPLDIAVIFDVSPSHTKTIMYDVITNWIIPSKVGDIDIKSYLEDEEAMARVSKGFSLRSNGVLTGAIGAIDGWLVKIIRPSWRLDRVRNPVAFFSRKGFFALNVQCIVDHDKKVLWASYRHKGASHDSSAFRDTKLYNLFKQKAEWLHGKGFYLLGDSAYAIESFILPPYPLVKPQSPEDSFNFYHSSARITVECAFGEIDLRWGVFWKRLTGAVDNSFIIIEGAMRLHNFLIDYRQDNVNEIRNDLNADMTNFMSTNDDIGNMPGVVVNDNRRPRGRISYDERQRRIQGLEIRDRLRQAFIDHNMHRPLHDSNDWEYDSNNHVIRT